MRTLFLVSLPLVSLFAAAACPALADDRGNEREGGIYARAHCAECHGVDASAEDFSPNADAPDFSVVANTPGMTEMAVRVWLQTSHPTMPDFIIPEEVRANLAAYIMSLKAEPSR